MESEPHVVEWVRNFAIVKLQDGYLGIKMIYRYNPHPDVICIYAPDIPTLKLKIDKSVEAEQLKIRSFALKRGR